jgi:hypothetical protein
VEQRLKREHPTGTERNQIAPRECGWKGGDSGGSLGRRKNLLSSTGITRLHRSYEPLRHPIRPGLSLASCQLIPTAISAGASRVASGLLCVHTVAITRQVQPSLFARLSPLPAAFPV